MLKDSQIYLFASFVTILINFLTLPFFTSYLSPADYGIIALFILFGNVTTNLISFGLNTASYGSYFKYKRNDFKILNLSVLLFLIMLFILFGTLVVQNFSDYISAKIFNNEISSDLLRISFISGCFSYFYAHFGQLLIAQKKAYYFSFSSILHVCTNALLTYYFIKFYSYTFLAGIYGIMFANFLAMSAVVIFNYDLFVFKLSYNKLKKAIIFGLPEVPKLIVGLLYSSFDKTMLANYKGVTEIGYYDFGSRFAGILKIFNDAIGKSFSPYFLENINRNNLKENILDVFYKIIFFLGFIGIGVSYFSEEALIVLTTKDFYVAKYLVPFLISYYLFGVLNQLASNQFIASQKLYYLAPVSFFGLIINVLLNIILIPLLGAIGAVISTAFVSFITSILLFYFGNIALKLPTNIFKIIKLYLLIFFFLILGYPILFIEASFALKVIIKTLLILLFLLTGIYLRFYSRKDLMNLKNSVLKSVQ
tara:strand:- start:1353 stop:2789 length:1437 start_codon:yes stop_codon:yes gene_type:complete